MTVIKFENGKPTLRDGKVGTESACCDQCCGDEIHTDPGRCCADTWHPDANPDGPCPEGTRFFTWGDGDVCCGCLPLSLFDPELNGGRTTDAEVKADLCCPGCGELAVFRDENGECPQRCCKDGVCTCKTPTQCSSDGGTSLSGDCVLECPSPCCQDDGSCPTVESWQCPPGRRHSDFFDCEDACKGACCKKNDDDEWEQLPGEYSKSQCDSAGGRWQGPGSTGCPVNPCCESVTSSAASLTFTPPDELGCDAFTGCGYSAAVTVMSASPVCVHGTIIGGSGCTEDETLILCNGQFSVTPGPGQTTLNSAHIRVCWTKADGPETIDFDCCGTFYALGNCSCSCVTTLVYDGPGCTSAANLEMRGDAVIDASGTGPLVLTADITNTGNCNRTLTLTGTNTDANEVRTIQRPPNNRFSNIVKDGTGMWRLNGNDAPRGYLTVKEGKLRVSNSLAVSNVYDTTVGDAIRSGAAWFLLDAGIGFYGQIIVPDGDQQVVIGGADGSLLGSRLLLSRSLTLVAESGTMIFGNRWLSASGVAPATQNVTIGAAGFAGRVFCDFLGELRTTEKVTVAYGVAELGSDTTLEAGEGVTIDEGATLKMSLIYRNDYIPDSNPGDLATSATITHDTLTVEFSGDPATGDQYVLLLGPTNNTITTVTLTGTTATGTYDEATSTLTID